MKRHPLLTGVLIFAGLLVIFGVLVFAVMSRFAGDDGGWLAAADRDAVGIFYLKGPILQSEEGVNQLEKYRKDDAIKAVVLRINSPGGLVAPSQELHEAVKRVAADKPVVASFADIAASGAYYVASGADGIMANPGSLTGSIGVIMQLQNFTELLEFAKVKSYTVKSGEYKDIGNPFRSLTPAELEELQDFIDNLHSQFVRAIVEAREMDEGHVRALANGTILTGEQAQAAGLVDRLGTFQDAIAWAGERADLGDDPSLVYPPEKKKPFIEALFGAAAEAVAEAVEARLEKSVRAAGPQPWYLYTTQPSRGWRGR